MDCQAGTTHTLYIYIQPAHLFLAFCLFFLSVRQKSSSVSWSGPFKQVKPDNSPLPTLQGIKSSSMLHISSDNSSQESMFCTLKRPNFAVCCSVSISFSHKMKQEYSCLGSQSGDISNIKFK